jgi:hypothetical protein
VQLRALGKPFAQQARFGGPAENEDVWHV